MHWIWHCCLSSSFLPVVLQDDRSGSRLKLYGSLTVAHDSIVVQEKQHLIQLIPVLSQKLPEDSWRQNFIALRITTSSFRFSFTSRLVANQDWIPQSALLFYPCLRVWSRKKMIHYFFKDISTKWIQTTSIRI